MGTINVVVVCVLGMHRSGTSAVAGVLRQLGVDLGPDERLYRPRPDNPEGFLEHAGLVEINDEILARFGGSWHEPPALSPGWERSSDLVDLRARASATLREDFSGRALWGWKDPRACLTLPFWRMLVPSMRYVLCIRSPLSVARSLAARDGFPLGKSGRLWLAHVVSSVTHTAGEPRLVVAYEDLVNTPEIEVHRLARFVGRVHAVHEGTNPTIGWELRSDLQHHPTSVGETVGEPALPFAARAIYAGLHWAMESRQHRSSQPDGLDPTIMALVSGAGVPDGALGALEDEHRRLVADHRKLLAEAVRLRTDIVGLQADLVQHGAALADLRSHPIWRAYLGLRSTLLPRGSRRQVAYERARRWLGVRRPGS